MGSKIHPFSQIMLIGLFGYILVFCLAQSTLQREVLIPDGNPIKLTAGMGATADSTDLEPMLLLISNASAGLAGANVYYILLSSTVEMDTLPAGIPGPKFFLQNWQGHKLAVTNSSTIPFAAMQLRLYSRFGKATKALSSSKNIPLAQYQSTGDTLVASTYQITVSASENTTSFVLLQPEGPLTIEVNSTANIQQADLIQTTKNSYSFMLTINAAQPILIINASKSPAARGQVRLLNLG